jgi:3-hydroxybutyrate dehydrogenase
VAAEAARLGHRTPEENPMNIAVGNPRARTAGVLQGKVSLVTGSTSGIGLGVARALAAAGSGIVLNGFGKPDEISAIQRQVADEFGVQVTFSGADMSKPDAIKAMVEAAQNDHGRLDIVVNNAGIQFVAPIQEFPPEKWDAILAINLSSAFHTSRHALPGMIAGKWGRIINIASAHGLVASPFKAAYVAAKHGIVGLTKVIALETAEQGITCNAICPGSSIRRWSRRRSTTRPSRTIFHAKRSSAMCCWRSNPTSASPRSRRSARSRFFSPATRRRRSPALRYRSTAAGRRIEVGRRPAPLRRRGHPSNCGSAR